MLSKRSCQLSVQTCTKTKVRSRRSTCDRHVLLTLTFFILVKDIAPLSQMLTKNIDEYVWNVQLAIIESLHTFIQRVPAKAWTSSMVDVVTEACWTSLFNMKYSAIRTAAMKALTTVIHSLQGKHGQPEWLNGFYADRPIFPNTALNSDTNLIDGNRKSVFLAKCDSYLTREVNNALKEDMKQLKSIVEAW
jgi:hypothetical protein